MDANRRKLNDLRQTKHNTSYKSFIFSNLSPYPSIYFRDNQHNSATVKHFVSASRTRSVAMDIAANAENVELGMDVPTPESIAVKALREIEREKYLAPK